MTSKPVSDTGCQTTTRTTLAALPKPQPSAVQWLRRLSEGEVSSVELMRATLERIEAADGRLNAVTAWDPERSLAMAAKADERRRAGEVLPLLGLPVSIKDSIDVAGLRCTGGSFAREQTVPAEDATSVARLRRAGAIPIVKTNVPEYSSSYETDNAIFGRTSHPLSAAHTPGGSSGGEGALLGADASVVGLGLDGGGSIRVPSHYCGIFGIRPTTGRVPDTGTWPSTRDCGYRDLMCVGPMARYAEDLALLLPILSGPDWIDPYAVPAPCGDPHAVNPKTLRVGFYDFDGLVRVSAQTSETIHRAAKALAQNGAQVEAVTPPDLREATELFFSLAGADGGDRMRQDLKGADGRHHEQFQTLLDGFGESMRLTKFFDLQGRAFAFRSRLRRFMIDRFDVLIAPVTTGPAPKHMDPPHGVAAEEYFLYRGFNYVHAIALAGLPSVVAPCGEQEGLPLGVQVVAQPWCEDIAIAIASQLEEALGGFRLRPSLDD